MNRSNHQSITELLDSAQAGDPEAFDTLYHLVYDELRRLARVMRRGKANETLNTTALVHEAYIKLLPSKDFNWNDRAHFFRVAARAMRQVLIDAAERRMAAKRGGGQANATLGEYVQKESLSPEELLTLNRALEKLERMSPRQALIVECRFFGGLSVDETAVVIDASATTVKREWRTARAWLAHALT